MLYDVQSDQTKKAAASEMKQRSVVGDQESGMKLVCNQSKAEAAFPTVWRSK